MTEGDKGLKMNCLLLVLIVTFLVNLNLVVGMKPVIPSTRNSFYISKENHKDVTQVALNTFNKTCFHQNIRLPLSIKPSFYNVTIHPNLTVAQPVFKGDVVIHVDCIKATRNIILHSFNLTIVKIKVEKIISSSKTNKILVDATRPSTSLLTEETLKWEECPSLSQINIPLRETVETGDKLIVQISFNGTLETLSTGFYLSNYKENGKNWTMAATQMEPDYARKAFPCFDEPEMKAIFQFQIIRDKNHFTLFNAKMIRSEKFAGELEVDYFEKSEIMSSYLVAFTVCPNNYKFREQIYRNISLRFFAPESQMNSLTHAINVTVEVLKHFEKLFGINYPMKKLDQIVVHNFNAGAMENWGLITYRPPTLLYDPNDNNEHDKILVSIVITHELAHQWFGNYVTAKWWNDIWLNEAFANYLENEYLSESIRNKLRLDVDLTAAMEMEIQFKSRLVALPNNYTQGFMKLFDLITYSKGGSLLVMMENFMGKENFIKGMRIYLNRHLYKNTLGNDLWRAMKEACDNEFLKKELDTIMKSWFEQSYFPIIHVNLHKDGKGFTVSQERFKSIASERQNEFLWQVPLKYITSHNSTPNLVWLKEKEQTFHLDKSASWIKMNFEHRGYFITNYDTASWNHIVQNIHKKIFDEINSAGILFDMKSLLSSSKMEISIVLDMVSLIYSRTEYLVWKMTGKVIKHIYENLLLHENLLSMYKNQLNKMIGQVIQSTGYFWNENKTNSVEMRTHAIIFQIALMADEKGCISYAMKEYEKTLSNASYEVNKEVRLFVLQYGIAHSGPGAWQVILDRYKNSTKDEKIKKELLSALSASRDWKLLEKLLKDCVDRKDKNILFVMEKISEYLIFNEKLYEFFRRHSNYFINNHEEEYLEILLLISNENKTQMNIKSIQSFFEKNSFGKFLNIEKNVKKVAKKIVLDKKYLNEIEKYYKSKFKYI